MTILRAVLMGMLCLLRSATVASGAEPAQPAAQTGDGAPLPETGPVFSLPALTSVAMWQAPAGALKRLTVAGEYLRADVTTLKDEIAQMRLKQPQPIPAWADNLYFRGTNTGGTFTYQVDAIILDRSGREFYFYSKSAGSYEQGKVVSHPAKRLTEFWYHYPAFQALSNNTYSPQDGVYYNPPRPPYRFAGLRIRGCHGRESDKDTGEVGLLFAGFALTGLSPTRSELYYQFADQEFYGELSPFPYLTPGQVTAAKYGRHFAISWELRRDYAGAPLLAGSETLRFPQIDESGDAINERVLAMARHIQMPVREKGTFWVRTKLRWSRDGGECPDAVSEKEFRLYIDRGDGDVLRGKVPADGFDANSYVRIAPARDSLIFSADEKPVCPVLLRQPQTATDLSAELTLRNALGDIVRTTRIDRLVWDADKHCALEVSLADCPPGSYEATASLLCGGKVFDRVTRLIGCVPPKNAIADSAPIPASVPSWKEVLPQPQLFLCPMLSDRDNSRNEPKIAWENHYKPFLDEAAALSKTIELPVHWAEVERLPGIYDWGAVDRFVDYAQSRGLKVDLWPEFRSGGTPEWLPSICEKDPQGRIYGANMYLFHNTRPNLLLAPEIRGRLFAFFAALVERYRTHPAVLGYFACLEHPRDAPYVGWREGYSEENLPFFIAYCQQRFGKIEALNARWGTTFRDFAALRHPQPADSPAFRADWLLFRLEVIESFLKDFVRTVRSRDDRREIIVYLDGVRDYEWFRDQGCLLADGGSHNSMSILGSRTYGLAGVPYRTEDHMPGRWTAYFPQQIEASLANIAAGGGQTTCCKAYVRTDSPDFKAQLADADKDLGKLQKLWPVWTELHRAHAYPPQAFVYGDTLAALAAANSTCVWDNFGGPWVTLNVERAQLGAGLLSDRDPPADAKLLLALGDDLRLMPVTSIERLERFVKKGGTLVMLADCGRRSLEPNQGDWLLLKHLGFSSPEDAQLVPGPFQTQTVKGKVFAQDGETFGVRDWWRVPYNPAAHGELLARNGSAPDACAMSWKPCGAGKAVVIWGKTVTPYGKPFLQDLARWAGVDIRATSDQPGFWASLQYVPGGALFYGVVAHPSWPESGGKTENGKVGWPGLPDGNYKVTALIAGRELGVMPAESIRAGLPLELPPQGAEFFRFEKTGDN